jgi:hypothetical protein
MNHPNKTGSPIAKPVRQRGVEKDFIFVIGPLILIPSFSDTESHENPCFSC